MAVRIGFDIGGTKLAALAMDDSGHELGRAREPVPASYEATLATLQRLISGFDHEHGSVASIGIAMPGRIDRMGSLLRVANLPWLERRPLGSDLEATVGRPVTIANDANCFALSEAIDGAGAEASLVFGAILGTGVGGGIVVDRQVLVGANANAGEWGHNRLPVSKAVELTEPVCGCGRAGCIEAWLNGAGLQQSYRQLGGDPRLDAAAIALHAQAGETAALEALERYAERLALALATIINSLDPDVIVLGGGLSQIASLYERVPRLWSVATIAPRPTTRLLLARHGPESGLRGAAWLSAQKKVRMPSKTR